MFTWDKFNFYPLPTYLYKAILNKKELPNIGQIIGIETKKFVNGVRHNMKLGCTLALIAEGFNNFGYLALFINGLIYRLLLGFIQSLYNKILLARIKLFDIFVLNTLGIVTLMMRFGSNGIYNWILNNSFVIFLPPFIIDTYQRINFQKFPK